MPVDHEAPLDAGIPQGIEHPLDVANSGGVEGDS